MKKSLSYTVVLCLAGFAVSFAAPPDKEAMIAKEKSAWQTFKDKKTDEFKKLLSPNFMGVYGDGIYTLQQQVDAMQKWDLRSFALTDTNVAMTDANTAIVTCKAKIDGTYGGQDVSGDYNSGSIWQKGKDGAWHAIFHTDMKQGAAAATPATSP